MDIESTTNVNQNVHIHDKVNIKVHRFNSLSARFYRWLKGHSVKVKQGVTIDGYVTANVRRWDEQTKDYGDWRCVTELNHNLLTNAGKDFFFAQCYKDTGLGTNGTYYVGVTATAITPAVGDTTMTGELATNGFSRAAGTYAHTVSTTTATITITYTATGAQSNVQGGALFTASSAGTMSHEFLFTSTTFAINDQLQLVITITFT